MILLYKSKGTKVRYDNINFDSTIEKNYYIKLRRLQREGKIKGFEVHVKVQLFEEGKDFRNKKILEILHYPDFKIYLNDGTYVLVDVKGNPEPIAILKRKIFMLKNPDVRYFFISTTPKYLNEQWVEVSKGTDFRAKLKLKYSKLHGKWGKGSPNWTFEDWDEGFNYECYNNLFYTWISTKKPVKPKINKKINKINKL